MNLAIVRQRYTPFGGAERFLERAMPALQQQGVRLTLLTRHWQTIHGNGHDNPVNPVNPDYFHRIIRCRPFHVGRLWRDWSFSYAVCRAIEEHDLLRTHIVQSHERIPCCHIYRAGDGVHREWLHQRTRFLESTQPSWRRIIQPSDLYHHYVLAAEAKMFHSPILRKIVCNSRMVANEIHQHYGVPHDRMAVIYSGIDIPKLSPEHRFDLRMHCRQQWQIDRDDVLFLYVGSGFQRKGVDILLRVWCSMPKHARLLVVGKDRALPHYQAMATRLGVAGRVVFTGAQTDVGAFYVAADAFVLPTLYDPFPNVILEAMAYALPVITSYKSGASDLLVHAHNGLLGDAMDPVTLQHNLQHLLDPDVRHAMGVAGHQTVQPYSMQAMAAQWVALYHTLLPERT
jgi:UDP-glucose:(heptosyl)LPS alpha-1,3-glucosyltransferase